jgi:hypothetical protein
MSLGGRISPPSRVSEAPARSTSARGFAARTARGALLTDENSWNFRPTVLNQATGVFGPLITGLESGSSRPSAPVTCRVLCSRTSVCQCRASLPGTLTGRASPFEQTEASLRSASRSLRASLTPCGRSLQCLLRPGSSSGRPLPVHPDSHSPPHPIAVLPRGLPSVAPRCAPHPSRAVGSRSFRSRVAPLPVRA